MFRQLFIAWCLMASSVVIHAYGVVSALQWLRRRKVPDGARLAPWAWLFVAVAGWIIVLHVAEIVVWAVAYTAMGAMPDIQSGVYFSAVTYTTTGYGDLVLPQSWRLVGAVEALTGILLAGWSTGFFFAVVARMHERSVSEPRA
jgi:ion channel